MNRKILFTVLLIILLSGCLRQEEAPGGGDGPGSTATLPAPASTATAPTATPSPEVLNEVAATPSPTSSTPQSSPTPTEEQAPTPTERPSSQEATQETPPPTAESTPTESADAGEEQSNQTGECTDIAAFYGDVNYPDDTLIQQGESFEKIWKIRNVGTCDWDDTYSLIFAGGEQMNAPISQPLPSIPAGQIADISVELTAPNRGGSHTSYWQFADSAGNSFGVNANRKGLIWVQIDVAFFVPGGTPTPAPQAITGGTDATAGSCTYQENDAYVSEVLNMANEARAGQGLAALSLNSQLSAAALQHSIDMGCNNFVGHTGSDGSTWYDRVTAQGYANSITARENIYVGNPDFGGTPQGAMNFWLNSQVHRDNLFNQTVSDVGIAYVFVDGSEYGGYYTLVLARP